MPSYWRTGALRTHPLHTLNDVLSVIHKGRPGWRLANAAAISLEERRTEAVLHQANSFACRGQGHAGPHGAMRDTRRLDHK